MLLCVAQVVLGRCTPGWLGTQEDPPFSDFRVQGLKAVPPRWATAESFKLQLNLGFFFFFFLFSSTFFPAKYPFQVNGYSRGAQDRLSRVLLGPTGPHSPAAVDSLSEGLPRGTPGLGRGSRGALPSGLIRKQKNALNLPVTRDLRISTR